ncbi:MAG: helix-turn-helix domain-containing protein [Sporichthyaceae bacterium]
MNVGAMLRTARDKAGLSQRQVADHAGIHPSMVSAYERGRRRPGIDTLEKLLAASGMTLAVELVPVGTGTGDRIERALRTPSAELLRPILSLVDHLADALGELRFALDGEAAAAVHGVPVEVRRVQVLLADEGDAVERAEAGLAKSGVRTWIEHLDRFCFAWSLPAPVMRLADPSRWMLSWERDEFEIALCTPDRMDALGRVHAEGRDFRAVGLWELELTDPDMARLLATARDMARAAA